MSFETSLRSTEKISQELKEREKKWCNVPKKDKKGFFILDCIISKNNLFILYGSNFAFYIEFPTFLPKLKEEIKMRQTFKDGDLTKMKLETAL